jgi:hypothetical protein
MPGRAFVLCALALMVFVFSGCSLTASPEGVPIAISGAPVVRIVSPPPNATYLEGVRVNIQALITNAGADIARVVIAVDETTVETLETPNSIGAASFSVTGGWVAAGLGQHIARVSAERADGTHSDPVEVAFTVVANSPAAATATPSPTPIPPTATAQPTDEPADAAQTAAPEADAPQGEAQAADGETAAPAEAATTAPTASGAPQATFNQGINVRSGPSTQFVPPIGSFAAGQTAEIVAVNTDGTWLKVRYYNGTGWVFGGLATVSGDISGLPREAGPPLPTATPVPPQPTAAPVQPAAPTGVPASSANVNLVAGIVELNPGQPVCNQTFTIGLDVANLGGEATAASSTVSVVDVRAADGTTQQTTTGGFPVLQPGQTFRVNMALTVSTYFDETHEIRFVIDPNNGVPENNESDNTRTITYTLQRGGC